MTIRINLLAPERRRRRVTPLMVGAGALAVLVLVLVVVALLMQVRVSSSRARLAQLNAEIERLRPEAQEVERMRRVVEGLRRREALIRQFFASQIPAAEAILDLSLAIPQDSWITLFAVQGGRAVQIEGVTARDNESIALFLVNLEQTPHFENMDLQVSELQRIGTQDVLRFTLTGALSGGPQPTPQAGETQ
ncbi:MAG: PilN domain-containing protein [Armatimonadota bacterium]|nr:PilN domain-containing protein [Armatimonadota bacterium]MDR7440199.1 PilN domain-containing protein [Armatimonadota bacterium]MDR7562596.1 PilN domain-containing protein [Armatimonadota bacterium]MDR7567839.1 PilN domain-containing protein [Armatimonadota bacterium]MDR7602486.1 PilN domain-containing protein [Armatimonadota bacterium]